MAKATRERKVQPSDDGSFGSPNGASKQLFIAELEEQLGGKFSSRGRVQLARLGDTTLQELIAGINGLVDAAS